MANTQKNSKSFPFSFFEESAFGATIRNGKGEEIENPFLDYRTLNEDGTPRETKVTLVVVQDRANHKRKLNQIRSWFYFNHVTGEPDEYVVRLYDTVKDNAYSPRNFDELNQPVPKTEKVRGANDEFEEREMAKVLQTQTVAMEEVMQFTLPQDRLVVEQLLQHPLNKYRFLPTGEAFEGSEAYFLCAERSQIAPATFFLRYADNARSAEKREGEERATIQRILSSFVKTAADGKTSVYSPEVFGMALALEHVRPQGFLPKGQEGDIEAIYLRLQSYLMGAEVSRAQAAKQRNEFFKYYEKARDVKATLLFRFAKQKGLVKFDGDRGYHINLPYSQEIVRLGLTEQLAISALDTRSSEDETKRYLMEVTGYPSWLEAFNARKDGKLFNRSETSLPIHNDGIKDKLIEEQAATIKQYSLLEQSILEAMRNANASPEEIARIEEQFRNTAEAAKTDSKTKKKKI
jgi:hypothetical protein